jgi:hypothetical protein
VTAYGLFGHLPPGKPRHIWLDGFETVLNYHHKAALAGNRDMTGCWALTDKVYCLRGESTQISFFHWVITEVGDADYVLRKLSKTSHLLHSQNNLSLLLSAALTTLDTPVLKSLLELGVSPNEQFQIDERGTYVSTTAWKAFCVYFAARMIHGCSKKHLSLYCRRLADFLATG